jgi:hypothetical protein
MSPGHEAMNGLLQQAKRAKRGSRTSCNFIAILNTCACPSSITCRLARSRRQQPDETVGFHTKRHGATYWAKMNRFISCEITAT